MDLRPSSIMVFKSILYEDISITPDGRKKRINMSDTCWTAIVPFSKFSRFPLGRSALKRSRMMRPTDNNEFREISRTD